MEFFQPSSKMRKIKKFLQFCKASRKGVIGMNKLGMKRKTYKNLSDDLKEDIERFLTLLKKVEMVR